MSEGFSKLQAPLLAVMVRRENKKDLIRLKAIVEERGKDSSANARG